MSRINIIQVIREHSHTLRNEDTNRYDLDVITGYIIVPVILSTLIVFIGKMNVDTAIGTTIITSMSVLAGLMFNLLVLIFDVSGKLNESLEQAEEKGEDHAIGRKKLAVELMQDTYVNISFGVLCSIAIIIVATVVTLVGDSFFKQALSFLTFFLLVGFAYTLLMILKRLFVLLRQEIGHRPRAHTNRTHTG